MLILDAQELRFPVAKFCRAGYNIFILILVFVKYREGGINDE